MAGTAQSDVSREQRVLVLLRTEAMGSVVVTKGWNEASPSDVCVVTCPDCSYLRTDSSRAGHELRSSRPWSWQRAESWSQHSVIRSGATEGHSLAMPRSGSRGLTKARSQQQSMEGTAAEAARGSGSSSQVPHSPPQYRDSTDTEVEDCCPIYLGSCGDPSFVMPCLHRFCYACILQWAENKARCPLCKRKMTSILHSVRADDDFEEHVIVPPMTPPVILPASRAHREPDAPNPPRPGDHQQGGTAGDVQDFVGGFQLPNWTSCFSAISAIQQTLHSWFCQSLEMLFETVTPRAQRARVPEQQQQLRGDRYLPRQRDTHGATGQEEGSSSSLSPGPARSSMDEMPSTSSSAIGGGPSTQPSASTTIHVEQQGSQEEPERLCPGSRKSIRGSDSSPKGPRQPQKRRASSPKGSPARRRPCY